MEPAWRLQTPVARLACLILWRASPAVSRRALKAVSESWRSVLSEKRPLLLSTSSGLCRLEGIIEVFGHKVGICQDVKADGCLGSFPRAPANDLTPDRTRGQ